MSFVNELIPEDQKNGFTFAVATQSDGSKPTLWKWTVDKERDAYLVLTRVEGGAYEGTTRTEHYVLYWRGALIFFVAEPRLVGQSVPQSISWRVSKLQVPDDLREQEPRIRQLIEEAFDAKGLLYRRDRVAEVNVVFVDA